MMTGPEWIFAGVGIFGLWIFVGTIFDFRRNSVRKRDGTLIIRAEEPNAFRSMVITNLVCSLAFIAIAIGVIFFDWPVKK